MSLFEVFKHWEPKADKTVLNSPISAEEDIIPMLSLSHWTQAPAIAIAPWWAEENKKKYIKKQRQQLDDPDKKKRLGNVHCD